jgi:UDP-N-acetylmuramoyl-tripeptide--D-alanyl-D-alanine ligase
MNVASLYQLYTQYPIICTDTRAIKPNSIFFALKGPNFNANEYATEALQKGAAYAVIDQPTYAKNEKYIVVPDALNALQQLALLHRQTLNIPVIAIVGSNGKTTTKELITCVLKQHYNVHATPGNFNNHIGLPLTLLQLNKAHQIAIIEMGANHIGENALLCEIAQPNYGMITNNGKDHLEGFGSIEGVAQSNSELYYYLLKNDGIAFVNANDEWLMRMANRLPKKITYAANDSEKNASADIIGNALKLRPDILFTLNGNDSVPIKSLLNGDYNFDNIMAAVAFGLTLKIPLEKIKKGIEDYTPSNNRSQLLIKGSNTIYLDAYNANPSSMEVALKNFASIEAKPKLAIMGDMFELGEYSFAEHKNMIDLCTALNIDEVWLVGNEFGKHAIPHHMHHFATTQLAFNHLQQHRLEHTHLFLKGSRGMKLETLVDAMQ